MPDSVELMSTTFLSTEQDRTNPDKWIFQRQDSLWLGHCFGCGFEVTANLHDQVLETLGKHQCV